MDNILINGMLLCGAAIVGILALIHLPTVLREIGKAVYVATHATADTLELSGEAFNEAVAKHSKSFGGVQ